MRSVALAPAELLKPVSCRMVTEVAFEIRVLQQAALEKSLTMRLKQGQIVEVTPPLIPDPPYDLNRFKMLPLEEHQITLSKLRKAIFSLFTASNTQAITDHFQTIDIVAEEMVARRQL